MSAPTVEPLAVPNPATTAWVPVNGPVGNLGGGFEFGYDQITADVNVTSATEAAGTPIITCAPHTFDGNPVIVEFYSPGIQPSNVAGAVLVVSLFEGSTQIARLAVAINPAAGVYRAPTSSRIKITPSAGSHTYTVTAYQSGGSAGCFVTAGAGGTGNTAPASIRFTSVAYYTGPGAGIPSPVVNGQWVKGVGGAAVWSAITPADIVGLGVYQAYTPLGGGGLVQGNGSGSGRYCQVGKLVNCWGSFTLGTTSSVGGSVAIKLPVGATGPYVQLGGTVTGWRGGVGNYPMGVARSHSADPTYFEILQPGTWPAGGLAQWGNPAPWGTAWANTDSITWALSYEAG